MAISRIALEGLPHSEIFGSKPVCGSPKLIAAYHVLHRRPAPRHPPYALSSLTTAFTLLANAVVVVRLISFALLRRNLRLSMNRGLLRPAAASRGHHRSGFPAGKLGRWRPRPRAEPAGGADRARTGDPLVANQVLSQLSYSPRKCEWWA
jgi:hypothetical protein